MVLLRSDRVLLRADRLVSIPDHKKIHAYSSEDIIQMVLEKLLWDWLG
jgi:hypothetical protein